jgi:hypothetical protein
VYFWRYITTSQNKVNLTEQLSYCRFYTFHAENMVWNSCVL